MACRCVCTDFSVCRLCRRVARDRAGWNSGQFVAGAAEIHASWRGDRRVYYVYCYPGDEPVRAGEGCRIYRDGTDRGGVSDRIDGIVWRGETTV